MSYLEDWDDYLEPEETTTLGGDTMPDNPANKLFVTDAETIRYVMPKPEPTTLTMHNDSGDTITIQPDGTILLAGVASDDSRAIVHALRQWAIANAERQRNLFGSMGSTNLREGMGE